MINVKFYNYCEFYNAQPAQLQWCSSTDFQAWACPQPFAQWDHMPPCVWFFHSSYPCDNIMLNWSPSSPKIKFSEVSCKQTPIVHARGRYQNAVLSFPPVGQSCSPSQLLAPWPPAALTEVTLSPGCSQSKMSSAGTLVLDPWLTLIPGEFILRPRIIGKGSSLELHWGLRLTLRNTPPTPQVWTCFRACRSLLSTCFSLCSLQAFPRIHLLHYLNPSQCLPPEGIKYNNVLA